MRLQRVLDQVVGLQTVVKCPTVRVEAPVGDAELLGLLQQLALAEVVLHHELRQIAHHLRRGRHLQ